jgi:predicted HTH domain antitoxin
MDRSSSLDPADLEDALESGSITVSRAAERAEMSLWELQRFIRENEIRWVGETGLKSDLQDL